MLFIEEPAPRVDNNTEFSAGFRAAVDDQYTWQTGASVRRCAGQSPDYQRGYNTAMTRINEARTKHQVAALIAEAA